MITNDQELRELLVQQMRRGLRLPDVARRLEVDPLVIEAFLGGAQLTNAAMALLPKILANGYTPPPHLATKSKPMGITLTAKAIKVSVPLDPAELSRLGEPKGPRTVLRIAVGGRVVVADVNSKAIRKAKTTIAQHGVDGVICFVQGRLEAGDVLAEAGLAAQPKAAKNADCETMKTHT
jgi:hypothetical protein